jgi:RNase P subunit RPR2
MKDGDTLRRMNFLMHASHAYLDVDPEVSRMFTGDLRKLAQKNVLRLYELSVETVTGSYCRDPEVKRMLCSKCSITQVPGFTSVVRFQGKLTSLLFAPVSM